jgi:hypothetical protein
LERNPLELGVLERNPLKLGILERHPLHGRLHIGRLHIGHTVHLLLRSEVGRVLDPHLLGGSFLCIYAWSKEVGVLDGLQPYVVTARTCDQREYEQSERVDYNFKDRKEISRSNAIRRLRYSRTIQVRIENA